MISYSSSWDFPKEKSSGQHQAWKRQDGNRNLAEGLPYLLSLPLLCSVTLSLQEEVQGCLYTEVPQRLNFVYTIREENCVGLASHVNTIGPAAFPLFRSPLGLGPLTMLTMCCLKSPVKSLAFLSPPFPMDDFSQKSGGRK